jgi:creatinine amidohydrolase
MYEARGIAELSAKKAFERGGKVVVLPTIPFGNNEQQLDQVATISFQTTTARAILSDVARSLKSQGIDRLLILNAHGGNEFKPIVRDVSNEHNILIVVISFWQIAPEVLTDVFDDPGDHGGDLETSLLLHMHPELVDMDQASTGDRVPFEIEALRQTGVWTPRPWSLSHPDTGSGDPKAGTADKGKRYLEGITDAISQVLVELADATKGQLPYV